MRNQEFLQQASYFLKFATADEEVHWEKVDTLVRDDNAVDWFNYNVDIKGRRPYTYKSGYPAKARERKSGVLSGINAAGGNGYSDDSPYGIDGYGWEGFLLFHEASNVMSEVIEDKFWSKLKRQKGRGIYYDKQGNEVLMPGWWICKWRYAKPRGKVSGGQVVTTVPSKYNSKDDYLIYLLYVPSPDEREQKIHILRVSDKYTLLPYAEDYTPYDGPLSGHFKRSNNDWLKEKYTINSNISTHFVNHELGVWPTASQGKQWKLLGLTGYSEEATPFWNYGSHNDEVYAEAEQKLVKEGEVRKVWNSIKSKNMRKKAQEVLDSYEGRWVHQQHDIFPSPWFEEIKVKHNVGHTIWSYQSPNMPNKSLNPYKRLKQKVYYNYFNSVTKIPDINPDYVVRTKSRPLTLGDYFAFEKVASPNTGYFLIDRKGEVPRPTHKLMETNSYSWHKYTPVRNLRWGTHMAKYPDPIINVDYFSMDSDIWTLNGDGKGAVTDVTYSLFPHFSPQKIKKKLASKGHAAYLGPNLIGKKVEEVVLSKTKYSGDAPVKFVALINWNVRLPKVVREWNHS